MFGDAKVKNIFITSKFYHTDFQPYKYTNKDVGMNRDEVESQSESSRNEMILKG